MRRILEPSSRKQGFTEGGDFDGNSVGNDWFLADDRFHHVRQMGNHWTTEVKIEDSPN